MKHYPVKRYISQVINFEATCKLYRVFTLQYILSEYRLLKETLDNEFSYWVKKGLHPDTFKETLEKSLFYSLDGKANNDL